MLPLLSLCVQPASPTPIFGASATFGGTGFGGFGGVVAKAGEPAEASADGGEGGEGEEAAPEEECQVGWLVTFYPFLGAHGAGTAVPALPIRLALFAVRACILCRHASPYHLLRHRRSSSRWCS